MCNKILVYKIKTCLVDKVKNKACHDPIPLLTENSVEGTHAHIHGPFAQLGE